MPTPRATRSLLSAAGVHPHVAAASGLVRAAAAPRRVEPVAVTSTRQRQPGYGRGRSGFASRCGSRASRGTGTDDAAARRRCSAASRSAIVGSSSSAPNAPFRTLSPSSRCSSPLMLPLLLLPLLLLPALLLLLLRLLLLLPPLPLLLLLLWFMGGGVGAGCATAASKRSKISRLSRRRPRRAVASCDGNSSLISGCSCSVCSTCCSVSCPCPCCCCPCCPCPCPAAAAAAALAALRSAAAAAVTPCGGEMPRANAAEPAHQRALVRPPRQDPKSSPTGVMGDASPLGDVSAP